MPMRPGAKAKAAMVKNRVKQGVNSVQQLRLCAEEACRNTTALEKKYWASSYDLIDFANIVITSVKLLLRVLRPFG
jgi:hypothetical protein